jgi:hypothetical protein
LISFLLIFHFLSLFIKLELILFKRVLSTCHTSEEAFKPWSFREHVSDFFGLSLGFSILNGHFPLISLFLLLGFIHLVDIVSVNVLVFSLTLRISSIIIKASLLTLSCSHFSFRVDHVCLYFSAEDTIKVHPIFRVNFFLLFLKLLSLGCLSSVSITARILLSAISELSPWSFPLRLRLCLFYYRFLGNVWSILSH